MADRALELLAAPRPVARTRALRRLTRSLDALIARDDDARATAARVAMLLRPALADPSLLEARHCEPADDRYRAHLVHVHPAGRRPLLRAAPRPFPSKANHEYTDLHFRGDRAGSP